MSFPRTVSNVVTVLSPLLGRDTRAAAGNDYLSKPEQAQAESHIDTAAARIRMQGGPGTRVRVAPLDAALMQDATALIDSVNQTQGSGKARLSRKEAEAAFAMDRVLGLRVLQAYEIVAGRGLDTDELARTRVSSRVVDEGQVFMEFANEAEASGYQDPQGRSVYWLVVTEDALLKKSYVWGINDLWAERFDIDKLDGTWTTTGEH